MSESSKHRSHHPPSYIPVVAPRPTRSTLPSSLSLPQLNLAPPLRRPSVSNSIATASPSPTTSSTPQSASGISSFRSLRSLLPFGAGKQAFSGSTPNHSKSSFPNFGSVRRSMTGERKNSASFPRVELPDISPIISIESSPQYTDSEADHGTYANDPKSSTGDLFNASPVGRRSSDAKIPVSPSPPAPGLGDLSTIIEADTSGISKHIPNPDDSQELCLQVQEPELSPSHRHIASPCQKDLSVLRAQSYIDMGSGGRTPDSPEISAFELSTSKLSVEVFDAMDASIVKKWPKGGDSVAEDGGLPVLDDQLDNNLSFNLGSLDPDLAALLSPNRVGQNDQAIFGIKPSLAVSPSMQLPSLSPSESQHAPSWPLALNTPSRSPSLTSVQRANDSFGNVSYAAEAQSSPARRRSVSLTRSTASQRPISLSALPRLARSVTTSPFRQEKDLMDSELSPYTCPGIDDAERRSSADHIRRRQPPSPLSSNAHTAGTRHGPVDLYVHKPPQSRFVTPARRAASHSGASGGRPPARQMTTSSTICGIDSDMLDSITPPSRTSSSAGITLSSRRRLHYSRPSVDQSRGPRDQDLTFLQRTRKRSMSLNQDGSVNSISPYQTPAPSSRPSSAMSAGRPTAEWLGPRTAKAFAAAGLLDHDKIGWSHSNGSASHYGPNRVGNGQDPRAQFGAPSRMAFSEASESTSSWGRSRSASRTMTMSEAGGPSTASPTFSITPRTAFSGSSTAPTSVSASSLTNLPMNSAIQSMKEKHSVETEALLSALSDSQRTTKILREENESLRTRIQELEGIISQMRRQSVSPQPHAKLLSRIVYDRISQPGMETSFLRRPQPMQSQFRYPNFEGLPRSVTPPRGTSPNPFKETTVSRRRFSTTSSTFHIPPSNMSMLLHENDLGDRTGALSSRSVSPPSPTLIIPKRSSSLRHGHNRSMSSGGNISPTTANFSMNGVTGSPGSLHLRPEHEMHLGDLASLDLAILGDDSGDDNGL